MLRKTPPAALLAFGAWMLWALVRFIWTMSAVERSFSPTPVLISEGVSMAAQVLVLAYAVELASRGGAAARFFKVAVTALGLVVGCDVLMTLIQFGEDPWKHEWIFKAWNYIAVLGWNVFALALVQALAPERRARGYVAVAIAFVAWMPPFLSEPLFDALELGTKPAYIVDFVLRMGRFAALAWLTVAASHGETPAVPTRASDGLRAAARGLWIRVIAALVVVMMTLMMVGSRSGSMSLMRFMMVSQGAVAIIALVITGLGALRAARSGVRDLDTWTLTLAGGASLWATGVSFAQLPYISKAMYRGGDGYGTRDYMTALSLATPLVVALGVGVLATAVAGFAARRGNDGLRSDAQGKGIMFVTFMLVGIALQSWMLPTARSVGSYAMLTLLAAGAALAATIAMAKLLGVAADAIEAEPGLPAAAVVSETPGT